MFHRLMHRSFRGATAVTIFALALTPVLTREEWGPTVPISPLIQTESNPLIFSEGEDLLYEVSWWIFKIGQIRVKTLETRFRDAERYYTATAFLNSYRGLPFVDLHAITYTMMDSLFFSRASRSAEKRNNRWFVTNQSFNPQTRTLVLEESWQDDLMVAAEPTRSDTFQLSTNRHLDGLSILYYARANAHSKRTERIPTIIYERDGETLFRFTNKASTTELAAFEKPLRSTEVEGRANFKGLFGLTGDFRGWFSRDAAAVPLKGELRVILGNITIELKRWERNGWTPPFVD